MRKISGGQISFFFLLLALIVLLALASTHILVRKAWLGDFYGVTYLLALVVFLYGWAIVIYRLFLLARPLQMGELAPGSRGEFVAQVNAMFYLILFNSLIRTEFLPIPLKTLVYSWLGSRIGSNSYSPGTLLDPPLTELGDNTIVGHGATIYAHAIEGGYFALFPVVLGSDVTVGAGAIIMPDVIVGDGAIVSSGAVVKKGARIGAGECWGGVPAKYLGPAGQGEA